VSLLRDHERLYSNAEFSKGVSITPPLLGSVYQMQGLEIKRPSRITQDAAKHEQLAPIMSSFGKLSSLGDKIGDKLPQRRRSASLDPPKENAKPGNGEDWHVVDPEGSDTGSEKTQVFARLPPLSPSGCKKPPESLDWHFWHTTGI